MKDFILVSYDVCYQLKHFGIVKLSSHLLRQFYALISYCRGVHSKLGLRERVK